MSPLCMASNHTNAEICDGMAPTLLSHMQKDAPIVIDRAAYNQGSNAQYPHIEQTELDTMVARGPHAIAYSPTDRT